MPKGESAIAYQDIYAELHPPKRKWLARKAIAISKRAGFRILGWLGLMDNNVLHQKHRPMYSCCFWGDRPIGTGNDVAFGSDDHNCLTEDEPRRSFVVVRDFDVAPKNFSTSNVTYTPKGFAWVGKTLAANASTSMIRSPLRYFKELSLRPPHCINQGTIVQAQTPFTYGDWVPEHRNSIICAKRFPRPLLLPAWIGNRPYVQKELSDLGIEYITVEEKTLIKNAFVLSIKHRRNLILEDEVQAYRSAYNVPDVRPERKKIIYLSRAFFTRAVETAGRDYPSHTIGKIVEELGGRVVDVSGKDRDDYRRLAAEADIVIADHGGAMFNIMEWKPRVVIEIVEDGWWVPCFVFLSSACGANYHGIIRSSHRSETDLRNQINTHIRNGRAKQDRLTTHKISSEEAMSFDMKASPATSPDR